jgi:hypothetical protein
MFDALTAEDLQRNATRIGESVRAALYYLSDVIEAHNNEPENEPVDCAALLQTAEIKFVKPRGTMIEGLMKQFDVLLVQVVPVHAGHSIGHVLEQGYHVVPNNMIAVFKQIILNAHAAAVTDLLAAMADEGDEGEEDYAGDGSGQTEGEGGHSGSGEGAEDI